MNVEFIEFIVEESPKTGPKVHGSWAIGNTEIQQWEACRICRKTITESQAGETETQIEIWEGRHKEKERKRTITNIVDNKVFIIF